MQLAARCTNVIRLGILPALGTRAGERTRVVMKKTDGDVRRKIVVVRMNEKEYSILEKLIASSTEKTVSNYLRKVALRRPVTIIYRNGTADDFLGEMIQLKKELSI